MDQPLILALDQGTTSTRAILFAADGQPLAEAGAPLQQHYPQDGWVEHDAEEIFEASVRVLKAAVAKAGRTLAEVAAIGITNQRETLVVWEKATGRPIHKAIVWQDRRTEAMCVRLRDAGHERRVTEITGLLLDPYFSGTKLAWLLDNVAGAREAAAGELLAGTIDAWVIWKLTGGKVHATDATNASRTLLYDIRAGRWSAEMGGMLGVPLDLLPEVRDCAGDFGETDAAILGRAIPIRGVAGDQQAALMGQGCIRPGEMKATYGTGCFMLINTGEAAPVSGARLLTTVAARVAGRTTYALEGAIFIAGAAIQWLGEGLGIEGGPRAAEALAMGARDDLPVVLVPAFTGQGAPWWDANARGAIFGLTRDAGRPEIARAAFDACALQTRDLIEAMRADAPQAFKGQVELRIDGGMSRSPWFSQRLADLTGIGVCRATYQETTALGAALFAGLGAGIYRDMEEAAAARPATESYRPLMPVDPRERAYARWLDAVNRVGTI
ncbi:MAG: glycerol kinase GlpK [Phenylobacterium sp.]|uniref:glycerol kinase GlpK n=1 Tax=Phenylobacterium sp. TaxID=1871053 RepID=UPI001A2B2834|nr:glycerol kinase GlpK [Phenylobacterium sp.]MBJ7412787.1 glycerol kinase GlpK [Phenylobacterium sp.]